MSHDSLSFFQITLLQSSMSILKFNLTGIFLLLLSASIVRHMVAVFLEGSVFKLQNSSMILQDDVYDCDKMFIDKFSVLPKHVLQMFDDEHIGSVIDDLVWFGHVSVEFDVVQIFHFYEFRAN